MNLMKLAALKGLVLGGVFAVAALVSQPASADRDGWQGHGGGYHPGHDDRGWRDDDYRSDWRDHRDRRWHGSGRRGHDRRHDYDDGRVWCPTHRVYAFAWELRDSRRHRHDGGYRDSGYWERGYSGYRDRDRQYRGW